MFHLNNPIMVLIIHIFIRIFVVCCISTIEHIIAHSMVRLLRGAVEVLKALTGQIEAIHNNLDPATLFRIAANFSFRQESLTIPKNFKA
jgi:hypothetical protein